MAAFWRTVGSHAQVTHQYKTPLTVLQPPPHHSGSTKDKLSKPGLSSDIPELVAGSSPLCRAPHLPKPRLLLPSPGSAGSSEGPHTSLSTGENFLSPSEWLMQASPPILSPKTLYPRPALKIYVYIYILQFFSSNNKTFSSRSLSRGDGRWEGEQLWSLLQLFIEECSA